jgi:hypothetical protein
MPKYKLELKPSSLVYTHTRLTARIQSLLGKSDEESAALSEKLLNGKTVEVFFEYDRDLIHYLKEKLEELGIFKTLELTDLPKKSEEEIERIAHSIIERDNSTFVLVERSTGAPLVYTIHPTQFLLIEEPDIHSKVIEKLRLKNVKEMSIEEFNYRYM